MRQIPLFEIYWEKDDISSVSKVIKRGTEWTTGPEITDLKNAFEIYFKEQYACPVSSGTTALHAILAAYNIKKGDEVIVPSFTFIATTNAVIMAGATPVFADIEEKSLALDPESIKEKITKKTKAIIPIHYGGMPCKEIEAIAEIAKDHDILLIEDAAESLGARRCGKKVGTYGDAAIFSFCQNKVITCGEGGLVLTNDVITNKKVEVIASHGRAGEKYFTQSKSFDYIMMGYNYRMSSITAALALSQFKKLSKIISLRQEKAKRYNRQLSETKEIEIIKEGEGDTNVHQMYTIKAVDNKTREKIRDKLGKANIGTKVFFDPVHLTTFYKNTFKTKNGMLPMTEEMSGRVLSLPIYPHMEFKKIDYIVEKIKECFV